MSVREGVGVCESLLLTLQSRVTTNLVQVLTIDFIIVYCYQVYDAYTVWVGMSGTSYQPATHVGCWGFLACTNDACLNS